MMTKVLQVTAAILAGTAEGLKLTGHTVVAGDFDGTGVTLGDFRTVDGWSKTHLDSTYLDKETNCNGKVHEYLTAHKDILEAGGGFYYDPAIQNGWCKILPADLVHIDIADATRSGDWQTNGTGITYFPKYQCKGDAASNALKSWCKVHASDFSGIAGVGMADFDAVPGWSETHMATPGPGYYTHKETDCNGKVKAYLEKYATELKNGAGFYYDPNPGNGWCKLLAADSVETDMADHEENNWHTDVTGITYLPKLAVLVSSS